jgi:hypothetical protein
MGFSAKKYKKNLKKAVDICAGAVLILSLSIDRMESE